MKIFMATLATETNTFSPIPTGQAAFTTGREWFRNDASRQPATIGNIPLTIWRRLGEVDGHEVAESICTFAQPAGSTLRHVYEGLRDMILEDLHAAMPVDVVLLFMHGAMVAHGYDDCEGDTLAKVREIIGPKAKIGIELDLHCHLTEAMRQNADAIITYKEYPQVDIGDRATAFSQFPSAMVSPGPMSRMSARRWWSSPTGMNARPPISRAASERSSGPCALRRRRASTASIKVSTLRSCRARVRS